MIFNQCYKFNGMDKVIESYAINDKYIIANIAKDNLDQIAIHFAALHNDEKLFFILEVPLDEKEELKLQNEKIKKFHNKVYYIDGLEAKDFMYVIGANIDTFRNCGLINWGIGCQDSHDELMIKKYNILTIYSYNTENYKNMFKEHNIKYVDAVVTAWDFINRENPGKASMISNIDAVIKDLTEKFGMYLAETRECE